MVIERMKRERRWRWTVIAALLAVVPVPAGSAEPPTVRLGASAIIDDPDVLVDFEEALPPMLHSTIRLHAEGGLNFLLSRIVGPVVGNAAAVDGMRMPYTRTQSTAIFTGPSSNPVLRGYYSAPLTIFTPDGVEFTHLEVYLSAYHLDADGDRSSFLVYWETGSDGELQGSGVLELGHQGERVLFFAPEGFDTFRVVSAFARADVEQLGETGFPNGAFPFMTSGQYWILADNVRANLATDFDDDGRLGRFDNCPEISNVDQNDRDEDGMGDACDAFPDGGSLLDVCLEEVDTCQGDLDVLLEHPGLRDSDGDGHSDAHDLCADTSVSEEVDASGCSLVQFCRALDIRRHGDRVTCSAMDWNNDEPRSRFPRDCRVIDDLCVPDGWSRSWPGR